MAEVANRETPSWWLWLPYVWFFFASTRALSNWLAGGRILRTNISLDSGSPVDRLLMTILILLGLSVLGARIQQTRMILACNKWIVMLFALMSFSILWSNFPAISFRRCIRSMGALVMALVVLTEHKPLEGMRILLRRLYFVHIPLSIIAIKYFRNIGVVYNWNGSEEEWAGLTTDKNSLGQVAMCSGILWLWQILRDWSNDKLKRNAKKLSLNVLLLLGTLWLLRGSKNSHSTTGIVGFIACSAGLIGLQYLRKRAGKAKRIILATIIAASLLMPLVYLLFNAFGGSPVEAVFEAAGRDMTLTDRTLIWADVINDTSKNPVLGVGMGAFWVGPIGDAIYPMPNWLKKTPEWRPEQGHNGYIDTYAQVGVVGLTMLLVIIGKGCLGALEDLKHDFGMGSLRLALLVGIVLNNVTETSFLRGEHELWLLFLLVAANLPRQSRKVFLRKADVTLSDASNRREEYEHSDRSVSSPLLR